MEIKGGSFVRCKNNLRKCDLPDMSDDMSEDLVFEKDGIYTVYEHIAHVGVRVLDRRRRETFFFVFDTNIFDGFSYQENFELHSESVPLCTIRYTDGKVETKLSNRYTDPFDNEEIINECEIASIEFTEHVHHAVVNANHQKIRYSPGGYKEVSIIENYSFPDVKLPHQIKSLELISHRDNHGLVRKLDLPSGIERLKLRGCDIGPLQTSAIDLHLDNCSVGKLVLDANRVQRIRLSHTNIDNCNLPLWSDRLSCGTTVHVFAVSDEQFIASFGADRMNRDELASECSTLGLKKIAKALNLPPADFKFKDDCGVFFYPTGNGGMGRLHVEMSTIKGNLKICECRRGAVDFTMALDPKGKLKTYAHYEYEDLDTVKMDNQMLKRVCKLAEDDRFPDGFFDKLFNDPGIINLRSTGEIHISELDFAMITSKEGYENCLAIRLNGDNWQYTRDIRYDQWRDIDWAELGFRLVPDGESGMDTVYVRPDIATYTKQGTYYESIRHFRDAFREMHEGSPQFPTYDERSEHKLDLGEGFQNREGIMLMGPNVFKFVHDFDQHGGLDPSVAAEMRRMHGTSDDYYYMMRCSIPLAVAIRLAEKYRFKMKPSFVFNDGGMQEPMYRGITCVSGYRRNDKDDCERSVVLHYLSMQHDRTLHKHMLDIAAVKGRDNPLIKVGKNLYHPYRDEIYPVGASPSFCGYNDVFIMDLADAGGVFSFVNPDIPDDLKDECLSAVAEMYKHTTNRVRKGFNQRTSDFYYAIAYDQACIEGTPSKVTVEFRKLSEKLKTCFENTAKRINANKS